MDLQETIKRALADEFDRGVKSALEEYGGDAGAWSVVDGKLVDGRGLEIGNSLEVIAGEHNKALSAAKYQAVPELKKCVVCSYRFDHELLGKYGCPNCHGGDMSAEDGK